MTGPLNLDKLAMTDQHHRPPTVDDLIAQLDDLHPAGVHGKTDTWTGAAWSFHRGAGDGTVRPWVVQVSDRRTVSAASLVDALAAAVALGPSCFIVPPRPLEPVELFVFKDDGRPRLKWLVRVTFAEPPVWAVPPDDRRERTGWSGCSRKADAERHLVEVERDLRRAVERWDSEHRPVVESGKAFRWREGHWTGDDPLTGEERAAVTADLRRAEEDGR